MDTYNTESNEKQTKNIKGIRIQSISYFMIVISCVFYIFILCIIIQMSNRYDTLIQNINAYTACNQDASTLKQASDYLTEQVRLYVITTDSKYMDAYIDELYVSMRREHALEDLQNSNNSIESLSYLQQALDKSNELAATELYAIRLVGEAKGYSSDAFPDCVKNITLSDADIALSPDAKLQKAQTLVFDSEYLHMKELINSDISSCLDSIISDTLNAQELSVDAMHQSLSKQRIYISILFFLNIITFIMIIILIVKPLKIYVNCMKEEKMLSIMGAYEFKYLALTYNDIYNLKKVNESVLQQKAEQDPLTGLANRAAFEKLQHVLKSDVSLVLFLMDVDNFKSVNDTYGHKVGDQVLQKVAEALQKSFRSEDFVMRIGGDEFSAVVTHITPEQSSALEQKITSINEFLSNSDDGLPVVTLSIGAAFSDQGFTDDLYVLADKALYYVKEHGRNGYAVYQDICDSLSK
ncbi:MAG: GGDEF domain-containing protein [Lachnospiraceae bacterium]|nr:GGDEF domain-containing protein [Lachnospiraceae bacterium]